MIDEISKYPRLLVCEGAKDRWFFHQLIERRGLPRFHIVQANGNGGFFNILNAINISQTKRFNALEGILIAADNNDQPDMRFRNVCQHIERLFGAGTAPSSPLEANRTKPPVTILMIPWTGVCGHLESLCVEAAESAHGIVAGQVQTFMDMVHAERWDSEARRGKAKLRINLAVRCAQDPFVPLGDVFREERHRGLIPLDHRSFDDVAKVLAEFGSAPSAAAG